MEDYFISSNIRYAYDNNKYLKNGTPILNEDGDNIDEPCFKRYIQKETANFIYQNYNNIIVLVGAGAWIFCC